MGSSSNQELLSLVFVKWNRIILCIYFVLWATNQDWESKWESIKYKHNLILTSKLKQTVNDSLISYISTIIRILYMIQMSFQINILWISTTAVNHCKYRCHSKCSMLDQKQISRWRKGANAIYPSEHLNKSTMK